MRIQNATDVEISYELKAGPLRMTMSTCILLPGEEEVWTSPYRKHGVRAVCELHVECGGVVKVVEAADDATVVVVSTPEGFQPRVA